MAKIIALLLVCFATFGQTLSVINTGTTSNDGTGDSLRTAFTKANTNFYQLWSEVFTNIPVDITNSAAGKLDITNGAAVNLTGSLTNVSVFGNLVIDSGDELQDTVDYSLALTPNGNTPTENDASPRPRSVATIASLVADVDPLLVPAYARIAVLGYSSAGDGGGGDFRRVLASSGSTNLGTFFKSTANATYAWERIRQKGRVSVEMFGAKSGDSTSDQTAIMAAAEYMNGIGGGDVEFGEGIYIVDGLELPEFVTLRGVAQQGQKNANEGSSVIKLADGSHDKHVITVTNECQIINLQIDGNKANVTGTSYGIYFNRSGTYIESVVDGVSVVNAKTAGIYVNANEITIRNSSVVESGGYGIYVAGPAWDTIIQKVLVGWSGDDGLHFASGSAFTRIDNVDSYFSRGNGITFVDPSYVNFYRPQIDYSFKHGLELVINASGSQFDIYAPIIHDSNYLDDGRGRTNAAASGTYSELCISGTNYPGSLKFTNGRIAPLLTGTLKPLANLCWSNTVPAVGFGTYLDNIIVETASGTRTASGKSAADSWLAGYWTGVLTSYYDGTNAFTFDRSTRASSQWSGVTPINAPTTMNGALTLGSTLSAAGSISASGATATRALNAPALGLKISADTGGETFGISQFGDSLYIASDIDSSPSLRFNGPAGTFSFIGAASFNASVAASTFVSAGTQVSVGTTLELGHPSDTTLARSAAGVVTIEGVTVAERPTTTALTYSGTNVTLTATSHVLHGNTLTLTNNCLLTITSSDGASGGITIVPHASTSYTVYLDSAIKLLGGGSSFVVTNSASETVNLEWKQTLRGGSSVILANKAVYP